MLILIPFSNTTAQKEHDIWYFGSYAGLNFSNGSPQPIYGGKVYSMEGCASMADKDGNLLFYTNGYMVWNRNHEVMPNGQGLTGGQGSSTQAALILPKAGKDKQFYVFTVEEEGRPGGLSYSVVDIEQNGGLGDVVEKNIRLISPTSEKVTAVRHCNGKDVWIITHVLGNNSYAAFLVTAQGVQPTPVISKVGIWVERRYGTMAGQLKASLDGKKLAAAHSTIAVELLDFDAATGKVSNPVTIFKEHGFAYGVEFAPSGSLLYISVYSRFDNTISKFRADVLQFDLSGGTEEKIQRSRIELFTTYEVPYQIDAFQLGPDGKIYTTHYRKNFLGRINNPEAKGLACNYEPAAVQLTTNIESGLPTIFYYKKLVDTITAQSTSGMCTTVPIHFKSSILSAAQPLLWDFGDPASGVQNTSAIQQPVHTFSKPGAYNIRLIKFNPCGNDTLATKIIIGSINLELGKDTSLCEGSSLVIQAKSNATLLTWQDGTTASTYLATKPGHYWVTASNTAFGCIMQDSIRITAIAAPKVELGEAIEICTGRDTLLDAGNIGAEYLWSNGSTTRQVLVNTAGKLWVQAKKDGCTSIDTVSIRQSALPRFDLGNDQSLCAGQQLTLLVNAPETTFKWQDQSNGNTYTVRSPGIYFVDAINKCGTTRDSIVISNGACTIQVPTAFTPDNNGLNDVFVAKGTDNVRYFHLVIYDRWGGVAFETFDKRKPWNGLIKGLMAPVGNYPYLIRYKDQNGGQEKRLTGTVTLIR